MWRLEKNGGSKVSKGTYWNISNGERIHLDKEGILPGDSSESYLRFHPAFLLVVGPLMGLVYAIFLPLIAILMVIWVAGEKVFGGLGRALFKMATFSWQPSEAYLAGKKKNAGWKAEEGTGEEAAEKKEPEEDPRDS